jgi:hypothetical protein
LRSDKLIEELRSTADRLLEDAKNSVREDGKVHPVCVVLYEDGRKEFLYPRWQDEDQKTEAFSVMNQHIKDTEADAAVLLLETVFRPKVGSELPQARALFMTKRAFGFKEFEAVLFEVEDEVEWKGEMGPSGDYVDHWITAFEEVH